MSCPDDIGCSCHVAFTSWQPSSLWCCIACRDDTSKAVLSRLTKCSGMSVVGVVCRECPLLGFSIRSWLMMQGCDADLRRLIQACGGCPVGQRPASATGRQLPVGARAGLRIDAKKNRMHPDLRRCTCVFVPARLVFFQLVRGFACLPHPAALLTCAVCANCSLCWLQVHLFNILWQLPSHYPMA